MINFKSIKAMVIDPMEKSTITVTNPHKICSDKGKRVDFFVCFVALRPKSIAMVMAGC